MTKIWAASSILLALLSAVSHAATKTEIFSIGNKNKSIAEFALNRDASKPVVYIVGESSPAKDWPAYQPGSFDAAVTRSTMQQDWLDTKPGATAPPFEIHFDLNASPRGTFYLQLDAIFRYRRPAPPKFTLLVNGKYAASYRLNPHPSPELWWPNGGEAEGNTQYFGYESAEMQLPASFFVAGANTLSIECLDGFGIYYDHLGLTNDTGKTPALITAASVTPTVLYKNRPAGLVEVAKIHLRTTRPLQRVTITTEVGGAKIESVVDQSDIGDIEADIDVPAEAAPAPVTLRVANIKTPVYRGMFTPARHWQVYALLMEQADFGYNDLPARTLEWENRFIDKALEIQKQYPSYSFTLDAAANLESYLATRREQNGKLLLDHLKTGKWGINGLYANFFTGLSTPEELYRTLDYSLQAGHDHGLRIDSASQTDEPSITWGLSQVLADAGVRYFSNGSDPIRGAFNPIGLLNFHSPFYWESPTGSKILVWNGVSYTAVDDMTWGGWTAESARSGTYATSTFGLTRSLPLFLSQYERDDFPFDAVLLFGLHNDEIPLRHWGDADVIDQWNREYAYPKLIPATQRDFFQHITAGFPDKIKTFRGDGGAYWEDEAGADARITAMIRTSQTQLTAAEKFESVANWLQPLLKTDSQPFDDAWKNILLADSYVWSDANSFRRPESYRTRGGEATHRAWAESALQQTSDLRLVAMDKVAELVGSSKQGTVVFNPDNWVRSDLFDFELETDQILVDPTTNQPIPCGVIKSHPNYQDVRCWAAEVPSTGYKFYAIAQGKTQEGDAVALDAASPVIEGKFYKLEIDLHTGAIEHLFDKDTGKDLVDSASAYKLNEYVYVTGGDPGDFIPGSSKDNRILTDDVTLPLPKLEVNHSSLQAPPLVRHFPWGTVIIVRSSALNTPEIISTITLLDTRKQVNFSNIVKKTSTLKKEGIYFAFPFALQSPEMKYQGATAWVDPEKDMLPGANRQWFTTQGGVWGKGTGTSIAWSSVNAPLICFEDINRGLWPESLQIHSGTLFSYVMNNYWYTDAPAQQGGEFTFHYALTSGGDVSTVNAMSLTAEQRSPLAAIRHYNMGWKPTLPDSGSGFLNASPAGVNILTVRALPNGDSYLVRVQNTTASAMQASVEFPAIELQDAYLGSLLGDGAAAVEWAPHRVTLPLGRYEIKTLIVKAGTGKP